MYLHPTQPQFLVKITHKLSNKHYHHHTANLGTSSVAISRTTFSPKRPPWTSDHKPIDLTTPIPHLLMPLSNPHVHTRAGNYRHSAGRQEWRTCGAHTRLTRSYVSYGKNINGCASLWEVSWAVDTGYVSGSKDIAWVSIARQEYKSQSSGPWALRKPPRL